MTSPTTRMRASIPLLVLLAAVLPVRAAFRVTSLAPSGPTETMDVPRIEIVFSAPVVALGAAAPADAPPDWLAVDPPVLAAWRWAGTTTLIAEPKGPLPGATTWRLELAPSLRSLAGEPLTGERIYTFSTPRPAVIVMKDAPQAADLLAWAAEVGRYDVTTSLAPPEPIVLVWNQRMDGVVR